MTTSDLILKKLSYPLSFKQFYFKNEYLIINIVVFRSHSLIFLELFLIKQGALYRSHRSLLFLIQKRASFKQTLVLIITLLNL